MQLLFEALGRWLIPQLLRVAEFCFTLWVVFALAGWARGWPSRRVPAGGSMVAMVLLRAGSLSGVAAVVFLAERIGATVLSARAAYLAFLLSGVAMIAVAALWLVLTGSQRGLLLRNSAHVLIGEPAEDLFDLIWNLRRNGAWRVRPPEYLSVFRGDARKLTAVSFEERHYQPAGPLSREELIAAPHLALGLPDPRRDADLHAVARAIIRNALGLQDPWPDRDGQLLNRRLYADLPDDLYAAARAICRNTPRVIASQWQTFHLDCALRLRFVTLFNTADLIQRHVTIRALATLLDRNAMPSNLRENADLLSGAGFGDWNRTLRAALQAPCPALDAWRSLLLDPRSDFDSALGLIEPLSRLLPAPIVPHGRDTLALWEVLGELRNRFTGHGPLGLLMAADPAAYVGCLHRFFLTAMRDMAKFDLGVTLQRGKSVKGVDRGFASVEYIPQLSLLFDPGDGEPVNLYPYLLPSDGRLLTLNRIHLKEAEYVDFSATAAVEPSFVRRPVASGSFRVRDGVQLMGAIVVSAGGEGHYRTIREAIASAEPGGRILVRPGIYSENVVIDREIEIQGDGPVAEVVVETQRSNCIRMNAGRATVRGLTLRCAADPASNEVFAVNIPSGRLLLEGCEISSTSLSCIGVYGAGTEPTVRGCRIRDGRQSGVYFYDGASGVVEDCVIPSTASR
jgi:hypothetical protein